MIKQPKKAPKYNIVISKMLYTWDNKPIAQIVSNSEQSFLQESVKYSKIQMWESIIFVLFILSVITLFLIRSVDKPIRIISTCLEESNPQVLERLKVETTEFGYIAVLIDQFFQQREELKQEVEERTKAEQRARDIIDKAPFGVHFYDLNSENQLVFTGANLAADFILAVDNQRFIGKTIEEIIPNFIGTEIPDAFRKAAKAGERYDSDKVDFDNNGVHEIFEVHAFQIAPNSIAVFFRDITKCKQAEEAMRASEGKITKS
ncbi:MAG: PAS domain-containing protein [Candidatus Marinimicrobia bacterium]|nr:PAS domain-containing protein [Candidatus Neomarinimicrobiota bacterium]